MPERIRQHYLLCVNIQSYRDADGRRYLEQLWHKDVREHLRYIEDLSLAAPSKRGEPPANFVRWDESHDSLRFVDLAPSESLMEAVLNVPLSAARLWREIGRAEIIHTGVAGWPIPFG